MAAVAGAIAWAGVEAMQGAGAPFGVIDNGGDIALRQRPPGEAGSTRGKAALSDRVAFVVPPRHESLASAPHRQRSALPSRSALPTPSRSFRTMSPLPTHGRPPSATGSDGRSYRARAD